MNTVFQCLPKEILNYIQFLASEPTPTAKLIKELSFLSSYVLTNDHFCKLSHIQQFVLWDGNRFETYKSKQCLRKMNRFELHIQK